MVFQTGIKYLGNIIEIGKISLDPERTNIIVNFPIPNTVKSLRRFFGMAQFCSWFIPDFNRSLPPLYDLTRQNVPFNWTQKCQNAFDYVKNKLSQKPVLRSPNTSDKFILETDASDRGIGCCLEGITVNGEEFIVSYYSAKLTDTEFRWNIVEKEAYAILKAIEKFRHYLIGKPFILKTDNRVLTYLQSTHA